MRFQGVLHSPNIMIDILKALSVLNKYCLFILTPNNMELCVPPGLVKHGDLFGFCHISYESVFETHQISATKCIGNAIVCRISIKNMIKGFQTCLEFDDHQAILRLAKINNKPMFEFKIIKQEYNDDTINDTIAVIQHVSVNFCDYQDDFKEPNGIINADNDTIIQIPKLKMFSQNVVKMTRISDDKFKSLQLYAHYKGKVSIEAKNSDCKIRTTYDSLKLHRKSVQQNDSDTEYVSIKMTGKSLCNILNGLSFVSLNESLSWICIKPQHACVFYSTLNYYNTNKNISNRITLYSAVILDNDSDDDMNILNESDSDTNSDTTFSQNNSINKNDHQITINNDDA